MDPLTTRPRNDRRIILHFDYDCFYASVFENENPSLRSLPLAVQQKQIIVTCNYEARRRGLKKLQLVTDAKKTCPDVVIVLGEELGRFRDASKALYKFLEAFTWNGQVERLGFDEVFMDVTDLVDYNQTLLNPNDLENSFFQLQRDDPTVGFSFDATKVAGHRFPNDPKEDSPSLTPLISDPETRDLLTRLILGSYLAQHLRWSLEDEKGYTSTVGISTNKILAKLVGNLNKPKGQTTLLPPYAVSNDAGVVSVPNDQHAAENNVTIFLDGHEIRKIPGVGLKMSQRIRNHVLSQPAEFEEGIIYGGTTEPVTVHNVRTFPDMGPELLESILGGPGTERGIGGKIWNLINGIDDTEVQQAKRVPSQISIEDSYLRLDNMSEVLKELRMLATSLIKRMHTDLLEDIDSDDDQNADSTTTKHWIAHPKTIRLSTRPRPPLNPNGARLRSFNRISRSSPLPNLIFNLKDSLDSIVDKFLTVSLIPMFRKLHPQKEGWDLSLMNVAVMNMVEVAREDGKGGGGGRDIGRMFKRQVDVLREWRVEDRDVPPDFNVGDSNEREDMHRKKQDNFEKEEEEEKPDNDPAEPSAGNEAPVNINPSPSFPIPDPLPGSGSEDLLFPTQNSLDENNTDRWEEYEGDEEMRELCEECGAVMPPFAMAAHERFHALES